MDGDTPSTATTNAPTPVGPWTQYEPAPQAAAADAAPAPAPAGPWTQYAAMAPAPTPSPQDASSGVGAKIGNAIGDAATRVGSAIGEGYKSGVLTPEAQSAVEGVPVVGPALGLLSRDVGAGLGAAGGLFSEAQRGVAAAADAIVPPNRGGSLGPALAAGMEIAPAMGMGAMRVPEVAESVRSAPEALAAIGNATDVDGVIKAAGDVVNAPVSTSPIPTIEVRPEAVPPPEAAGAPLPAPQMGLEPLPPTPAPEVAPTPAAVPAVPEPVGADITAPTAIPELTPAQTATALQKMVNQSAEDRLTPQGRDDAVYFPGVERPEAMRDFSPAANGQMSTAMEHKTLYNTDSNYHDQFDAQVKKNNDVMVDGLNNLIGDANSRKAAMDEAKDLMPGPVGLFNEQRPVDAQPIVDEIKDILASPAGKRASVENVLSSILPKLYDKDGNLEELPSMLKGVRDDITDKLYDKTPTTEGNAARTARNQLNDVLSVIDATIGGGLPGTKYQDYLTNLSGALGEVSKQDYLQKFITGPKKLTDLSGNLQFTKVQNMLQDIQAHHADLTGGAKHLSMDEINQIEGVRNELAAKKLLDDRAGVRGSATAQLTNASGIMGSGPLGNAVKGGAEMALHAAGPFTHGATNLAAGAYRFVVKPMMAAAEARETAAKLEATKARLLDTMPRNPEMGAPVQPVAPVASPVPVPSPEPAPVVTQMQREQAVITALENLRRDIASGKVDQNNPIISSILRGAYGNDFAGEVSKAKMTGLLDNFANKLRSRVAASGATAGQVAARQ